jgi:hypothetical protein
MIEIVHLSELTESTVAMTTPAMLNLIMPVVVLIRKIKLAATRNKVSVCKIAMVIVAA